MNLRTCDCCGARRKELNRVEVGAKSVEWFVCEDCYTQYVPRDGERGAGPPCCEGYAMINDDSEIRHWKGGTTFSGPDAVEYFRVAQLWAMMGVFEKPNGLRWKHLSKTLALRLAGERTGKKYKRGEFAKARADLKIWLDVAKSSLPIIDETGDEK